MESADATRYRICVMGLSYLSQGRADLGEPVNSWADELLQGARESVRLARRGANVTAEFRTMMYDSHLVTAASLRFGQDCVHRELCGVPLKKA